MFSSESCKSLEEIKRIDQEIKQKGIGDHPMENRGDFSVANNPSLREKSKDAIQHPAGEIVQPQRSLPTIDNNEHFGKRVVGGDQTDYGEQDKQIPFVN